MILLSSLLFWFHFFLFHNFLLLFQFFCLLKFIHMSFIFFCIFRYDRWSLLYYLLRFFKSNSCTLTLVSYFIMIFSIHIINLFLCFSLLKVKWLRLCFLKLLLFTIKLIMQIWMNLFKIRNWNMFKWLWAIFFLFL